MSTNPNKIRVLLLSWRDIQAPKKGGAEVFTHEMLKRRDHDAIEVIHISPLYEGGNPDELFESVRYIRRGNDVSVIFHAMAYYFKHRNEIDYVVDQCNTHRFFTPFWVSKKKRILFIHQTTREIWLRQMKKPFAYVGYYLENFMLRIYKGNLTFTVSKSTQQDLIETGFNEDRIFILPEGIAFEPWPRDQWVTKLPLRFTYVGRYSAYKGIDATVEAFCKFKKRYPSATLGIIGKKKEAYIKEVLTPIINRYGIDQESITYYGFVSEEDKLNLMSQSHCLVFPSDREGWGLTVTEGAAVGTPSIVFNSAGLRDAVKQGAAGYMTEENTIDALLNLMIDSVENTKRYDEIQTAAYEFSKKLSWQRTGEKFSEFLAMIEEGESYGVRWNSYYDI